MQTIPESAILHYKATGFSMEPFILDGDELIIHARPAKFFPGDILLYHSPSYPKPVAHRLARVENTPSRFLMRSDAIPEVSEWIEAQAIIGRVEGILRKGDRPFFIKSSRLNRAAAIAYPWFLTFKNHILSWSGPLMEKIQNLPFYQRIVRKIFVPEIELRAHQDSGFIQVIALVRRHLAGRADLEVRRNGLQKYVWISSFTVRRRYRRAGIGLKMIEAAEAWARNHEAQALQLSLEPGNRAALALYQKMGFEIKRDVPREDRKFILTKKLASPAAPNP